MGTQILPEMCVADFAAGQDVETRLITHYNGLCCREPFKKLLEPFLTWIDDLRKL